MKILNTISDELSVILGNLDSLTYHEDNNTIDITEIPFRKKRFYVGTIIHFFLFQFFLSLKLLQEQKHKDYFVFFMEGLGVLPMFFLWLHGKKIVWLLPSSIHMKESQYQNNGKQLILLNLQKICAFLSYRIIVYSPNLISEWHLEDFKEKIVIAHEHFINVDEFSLKTQYHDRPPVIGHIGRFSDEKGTMDFVRAIPEILKEHRDVRFFIGGDGELRGQIETFIHDFNLHDVVELNGWISKDMLPYYLNRLQLLVLPSHTEGLPNMMLEAMACGTPIAATSVGSISDYIKDAQTGVLLNDGSPEGITRDVVRAIREYDMNKISLASHLFIQQNFTFSESVETFRQMFLSFEP